MVEGLEWSAGVKLCINFHLIDIFWSPPFPWTGVASTGSHKGVRVRSASRGSARDDGDIDGYYPAMCLRMCVCVLFEEAEGALAPNFILDSKEVCDAPPWSPLTKNS